MRRWLLKRMLYGVRAALRREPSPAVMRREMARAGRLVALREPLRVSPAFPLGKASAHWVESPGVAAERTILYLHGGAFVAESPAIHNPLLAALCRASGARGLMVNYRLAPEHPFPAACEDALAGYRHLLEQGVDPRSLVIAGDSAGGNLVLVTALSARDAGLPAAAGLLMFSPVLDATFSGDSILRNDGIDPLFRAATIQGFERHYLDGVDRHDPRVSPLWADLSRLPPALLVAGSSEILLDDSVRYAERAANATLRVWHDMPHVFPAFRGLREGAEAIAQAGEWIRARTAPAAADGG